MPGEFHQRDKIQINELIFMMSGSVARYVLAHPPQKIGRLPAKIGSLLQSSLSPKDRCGWLFRNRLRLNLLP
jgi:hypothetical protein